MKNSFLEILQYQTSFDIDRTMKRWSPLLLDVSWVVNFGVSIHDHATMVTVEGPHFSSQAESKLFQRWGGHVINMTIVSEVVPAKEYCRLANDCHRRQIRICWIATKYLATYMPPPVAISPLRLL